MQSQQLLAESQIFKDEFLTGTEGGNNPAEQMPEEGDHAPKSYRNRWQCSGRKLFTRLGGAGRTGSARSDRTLLSVCGF